MFEPIWKKRPKQIQAAHTAAIKIRISFISIPDWQRYWSLIDHIKEIPLPKEV